MYKLKEVTRKTLRLFIRKFPRKIKDISFYTDGIFKRLNVDFSTSETVSSQHILLLTIFFVITYS